MADKTLSVSLKSTTGTLAYANEIYDSTQGAKQEAINKANKERIDELSTSNTTNTQAINNLPIEKGTGQYAVVQKANNNSATGSNAIAMGNHAIATQGSSKAMGAYVIADGVYSSASGFYGNALNITSLVYGGANVANIKITITGTNIFTIDKTTITDIAALCIVANNYFWIANNNTPFRISSATTVDNIITVSSATAIPTGTTKIVFPYSIAKGKYSMAFRGAAVGTASAVANTGNYAEGESSTAFGEKNIVYNKHEFAVGCYNKSTKSDDAAEATMFSIGGGSATGVVFDRKNLLELKKNGDIYYINIDGDTVKLQDDIDGIQRSLNEYTTLQKLDDELAKKQDTLTSGTNIKTINNQSILGSGNISITTDVSNLATKTEVSTLSSTVSTLSATVDTVKTTADNALSMANTAQTTAIGADANASLALEKAKKAVTGVTDPIGGYTPPIDSNGNITLSYAPLAGVALVSSANLITPKNGITTIPLATSSSASPGIISYSEESFTMMAGVLIPLYASSSDVATKTDYFKMLTSSSVDDIVKVGITTNTQTLTSAQKTAAQKWLGVPQEWVGTQAEYDALTSYDENTKYYVIES